MSEDSPCASHVSTTCPTVARLREALDAYWQRYASRFPGDEYEDFTTLMLLAEDDRHE